MEKHWVDLLALNFILKKKKKNSLKCIFNHMSEFITAGEKKTK